MICPFCEFEDTRVLDTRMQKQGTVRRRRTCSRCQEKFTTVESLVAIGPLVIKKDSNTEAYNKLKIKKGVQAACQKRPVTLSQIDQVVDHVHSSLRQMRCKEITSHAIGKLVMKELKKVDHVAFIRFASVYRTFDDIEEFIQSLEEDPSHNQPNKSL